MAFVIITFPLKCVLFHGPDTALAISAVRDGSSFLLTLALRRIYRTYWREEIGRMIGLIVVSCALAGLLQAGFLILLKPFVSTAAELKITEVKEFDVLYERTGLLFGWSFLYFGIRHAVDGIRRELRLALIQSEKRQAQLQMLRAQVNPHFLFNALNSIRINVQNANAELGRMVQSLADFLRFSLDHSQDDFIPLGSEFDAMRDYLAVEKVRFRDKLEYHCEIDEKARSVRVPGILLQPLIENAIKYGLDTSEPPLRVSVHVACRDALTLEITVANSGDWLEPTPREKENHLGLQNLRRRLDLIYPGKHRLDITHGDGWVTVAIRIPIL